MTPLETLIKEELKRLISEVYITGRQEAIEEAIEILRKKVNGAQWQATMQPNAGVVLFSDIESLENKKNI